MISFTLSYTSDEAVEDGKEDETFQAVSGMTWGEWVESSYNTADFYIAEDNTIQSQNGYGRIYYEYSTDTVSAKTYHVNWMGKLY